MAKRNPKRNKKVRDSGTFSLKNFGINWKDRSPILRYLAGFILLLILFYGIYISPFFEAYILGPFLNLQTDISSFILNIFGMGTSGEGTTLAGQETTLNVAKGCDGLEASALYLIAVLLMPFSWRSKALGLLAGAAVLFVLNILRIVGLYLVMIYWPSAFEPLHIHGGFALFTIVAILLWVTWAGWAMRKEKKTTDVSG